MIDRVLATPLRPRPSRRAVRRGLGAILAATLAAGAVAPAPAALGAVYQVTFEGSLGGCALSGKGPASSGTPITMTVTLKSASGRVKARKTGVVVSDFGNWSIPCLGKLAIGDRLIATRKLGGTVFTLRSFTIPRLTVTLDRVTNKAIGRAPKFSYVDVAGDQCIPYESCTEKTSHTLKVPSSGTWTKTVGSASFDPVGGDKASATWSEASTLDLDVISYTDVANRIEVTPGSAVVTGYGTPGAAVTVTFLTSSGAVRGVGKGRANASSGRFKVIVRKNGKAVALAATNRVAGSVAPDARLTITPGLGLDVSDAANDHLTGTCVAGQPFALALSQGGTLVAHQNGTAGAGGTVDVTGLYGSTPIPAGTRVALTCISSKGDQIRFAKDVA